MFEYRRPRLRDPQQDYAGPGVWFITINTFGAEHLFGTVVDGHVSLTEVGQIARRYWEEIPQHFPHCRIDDFVVMPNHLHGILELVSRPTQLEGIQCSRRFGRPLPGTVGTIVGAFKAAVTREASRVLGHPVTIWQTDFYDCKIRCRQALELVRAYIDKNPARWAERCTKRRRTTKVVELPPIPAIRKRS